MLTIIAIFILCYLLGSIPFGIIIGRIWKGIDIRNYGSKSAGFTNVYRVVGTLPAAIVLFLDIAKGMAAVLLITQISFDSPWVSLIDLKVIASVSVIVGHVFPIFFRFRGGKGIATGLGALWSILPVEVSLALFLFIIVVAITKYVSLGSLSAITFLFLALIFEKYYLQTEVPSIIIIMIVFLTAFIFFNHRNNIKRLLNGTENKFGRKKAG